MIRADFKDASGEPRPTLAKDARQYRTSPVWRRVALDRETTRISDMLLIFRSASFYAVTSFALVLFLSAGAPAAPSSPAESPPAASDPAAPVAKMPDASPGEPESPARPLAPGRDTWERLGTPFQIGFVQGYVEAAVMSAERDPNGYWRTRMPRWEGGVVRVRHWMAAIAEYSKTPDGQVARPRDLVKGATPYLIEKFGMPPDDTTRMIQRQMKVEPEAMKKLGFGPGGEPPPRKVYSPEERRAQELAFLESKLEGIKERRATYPARLKRMERRGKQLDEALRDVEAELAAHRAKIAELDGAPES